MTQTIGFSSWEYAQRKKELEEIEKAEKDKLLKEMITATDKAIEDIKGPPTYQGTYTEDPLQRAIVDAGKELNAFHKEMLANMDKVMERNLKKLDDLEKQIDPILEQLKTNKKQLTDEQHDHIKSIVNPSKPPTFEEWMHGFESRYTEEQLWHMKWAFEVGVSLTIKRFGLNMNDKE